MSGIRRSRAKPGVAGYYIRIAPESPLTDGPDLHGQVQVRNHEAGTGSISADALVSTDALALVRFGLRAPDDPRILDTVEVIDKVLKVDLPQGPGWRRYNLDGYGEKEDGRPFDGVGIGRVWPLLAGERAHYALAAGRRAEAEALLATIEAQTSPGGLIPEQVWDGPPIPARELAPGQPSGSAMPLVWAHAEYVKLLRSLADGAVFDMPPHTVRRYVRGKQQRPLPAMARGLPDRRDSRRARVAHRPHASGGRPLYARRLAHAGGGRNARCRGRPVPGGNRHRRHVGGRAHRLHLARQGDRRVARTQLRSRDRGLGLGGGVAAVRSRSHQ